ncbi:MAG: ribonuclease H-like domain-containing protein [candidate division Zixibacteria bacterium]|nr:ribonuclease H-like domain-containing protein [candidate division Zixibacteria bacterium]
MKKKRRLQTLDKFLDLPGDTSTGDENLPQLAEIIGAEIIESDGFRVLKIIDDHDIFPYSNLKDIDEHRHQNLYRNWHFVTGGDETTYDPEKFLFFDTETTGLSGTGMVIFLIGYGYFYKNVFRVVQYFLPDYPDEEMFLKLAGEHLKEDTILVTYNGKSFDWPMLTQRFAINRMDLPEIDYHLDALHPARSLFRRLGEDCTLITLEKELLSFDRGEDVPGFLIPAKYFDYLYDRQPGKIPEIIRHNRLDVISLALVARYIPEVLNRPEIVNSTGMVEGAINHFFKNKRYDVLLEYISNIKPGYIDECSLMAQLQYSLTLKKVGQFEEASQIWTKALSQSNEPQAVKHLIELAKYQEHKEKDPFSASDTVDLLLNLPVTPGQKKQLLYRKKRLIGKCLKLSSKSL